MMRVRHSDLDQTLSVYYREKIPVLLLGKTGTGKSTHLKEFARRLAEEKGLRFTEDPVSFDPEKEFLFLDIRASHLEPTDLLGIPTVRNGRTEWNIPEFLPEQGEGVIFFDEINHASENTLHALYQVILDRRAGWRYRLPDGFWVVAAGNTPDEDPFLTTMPAPLRARFAILELEPPSAAEWIEYVGDRIDRRVVSFISKYPSWLYKFREEMEVFPTPRGWERAGKLIKDIEDLKTVHTVVGGLVGLEAASAFVKFVKSEFAVPPFEEVVNNPDMISDMPLWVVASYTGDVVELYGKNKEKAAEVIAAALVYRPEAGIVLVRTVTKREPTRVIELGGYISKTKYGERARSVLKKMREYRVKP